MEYEERRKIISHCEQGLTAMVEFLQMKNGGYNQMIDADEMKKCIKWFCGDNARDLIDYIKGGK